MCRRHPWGPKRGAHGREGLGRPGGAIGRPQDHQQQEAAPAPATIYLVGFACVEKEKMRQGTSRRGGLHNHWHGAVLKRPEHLIPRKLARNDLHRFVFDWLVGRMLKKRLLLSFL